MEFPALRGSVCRLVTGCSVPPNAVSAAACEKLPEFYSVVRNRHSLGGRHHWNLVETRFLALVSSHEDRVRDLETFRHTLRGVLSSFGFRFQIL